jgi:hypothetical protein
MLKMLNVNKWEQKQVGRQTKGKKKKKKTITEGQKKPVSETIQSEGTEFSEIEPF